MIVFNIIVWSIVSAAWAFSAWSKSFTEDTPIWPDILASVGAAGVAIVYMTKMLMGWA